MPIIDIHAHMFGYAWLEMVKKHGAPAYGLEAKPDGRDYVMEMGSPACALEREAMDYDLRIKQMDKHGIDISIVSLTSPYVCWGGPDISPEVARLSNDEMAGGQAAYPDRFRWFCSLPWEYPDAAIAELGRSVAAGTAGVMAMGHINERHLIDPLFAPVWAEIDRRQLPVLLHPTAPYGAKDLDFGFERILMPGTGFMFDTTFAIARMVIDGFFDRYTQLRIIASHGGGYLPYVAHRLDVFFGVETLIEMKIKNPPSSYLENIHYDAIVYDKGALDLCIDLAGYENVMFGTDLPMPADVPRLYSLIDTLPADQADAIKCGNALRMFGL